MRNSEALTYRLWISAGAEIGEQLRCSVYIAPDDSEAVEVF